MFSPTASNAARSVAFVKALPGARRIEKNADGTYSAEFAGPKEVNALIDDLNRRHAAEVIDLFQFLQCKYRLF